MLFVSLQSLTRHDHLSVLSIIHLLVQNVICVYLFYLQGTYIHLITYAGQSEMHVSRNQIPWVIKTEVVLPSRPKVARHVHALKKLYSQFITILMLLEIVCYGFFLLHTQKNTKRECKKSQISNKNYPCSY